MPATADGASRSAQYRQYCADDKEDDPEDQEQMGEGEGGDKAGEEEREDDKDDSETDHGMYLVSESMREKDGGAGVEGVMGIVAQAIWARLDVRDLVKRKACFSDPVD